MHDEGMTGQENESAAKNERSRHSAVGGRPERLYTYSGLPLGSPQIPGINCGTYHVLVML